MGAREKVTAGSVGAEKSVSVGTAEEKDEAGSVGFAKTIRNKAGQFMVERRRRRWVAAALTVGGGAVGFFALGVWGASARLSWPGSAGWSRKRSTDRVKRSCLRIRFRGGTESWY